MQNRESGDLADASLITTEQSLNGWSAFPTQEAFLPWQVKRRWEVLGNSCPGTALNHCLTGVVGKYLVTFVPQVGFFQGVYSIPGVPQWDSVRFP